MSTRLPRITGLRSVSLPAFLAALSFSTIVGSFIIQWYVLTRLGASVQTDALFAAMTLPTLLYDVLSGALGYVLVPMFSASPPGEARRQAWSLAHLLGILLVGATALFGLSAGLWLPPLVPGFSPEARTLAVSLTRILMAYPCFAGCSAVCFAYLQSQHRFIRSEFNGFAAMCVSFVYLFWALPRQGLHAAAWTMVVRSAAELLLHVLAMGRYSGMRGSGAFLRKALHRARPVVVSGAIFRTDLLVDRFFASSAPAGSLSILNLSRQIQHAVARVLAKSLVAPVLPGLGRAGETQAHEQFAGVVRSRIRLLLLVCCALALGLLALGHPALTLVFRRKNLGAPEVALLYRLSVVLCGLMAGDVLTQFLSAAFYARGDTRTPSRLGVICYVAGIALKAVGFWAGGVLGLAIALSIYYALSAVGLLVLHLRWWHRARANVSALASGG